jgi:hypothetical protein
MVTGSSFDQANKEPRFKTKKKYDDKDIKMKKLFFSSQKELLGFSG